MDTFPCILYRCIISWGKCFRFIHMYSGLFTGADKQKYLRLHGMNRDPFFVLKIVLLKINVVAIKEVAGDPGSSR